MDRPLHIKNYCHIRNESILLNGKRVFEDASEGSKSFAKSDNCNDGNKADIPAKSSSELASFLKSAYQYFGIDYPKFFKMDRLSKLAFMSAEILLGGELKSQVNQNTAILLSNRASSLDTDRKYQKSISDPRNFYPSPAVFVYTLPNICIGEISIRHQLRSENSFFIFDAFDAEFLKDYAEVLLGTEKADEALCGWIDVDENRYEAFLYIVSPSGSIQHTEQQLTELYQT